MSSHTFTFVLEYDGGTYIEQAVAANLRLAIIDWLKKLQATEVPEIQTVTSHLSEEFSKDEPAPLGGGLKNVWCCTALVGDHLALLNIVKTESD